jgi:hypothetical protein
MWKIQPVVRINWLASGIDEKSRTGIKRVHQQKRDSENLFQKKQHSR